MADVAENAVLVIGAGVSGLTTAICLAEAGAKVRVRAALPPPRTTSAAAGASWGPYLVSDPRVLRWSLDTLRELQTISRAEPMSGVRLVDGMEAADFPMDAPDWARAVDGFRECEIDELPAGYASGWRYTIPLVEMGRYLGYLEARLNATGTRVEIGSVDSLDDVIDEAAVIMNCTGLGSRVLTSDTDLHPSRGQIVVVTNPGIHQFFQDYSKHADPTYILPHGDHIVLGGSLLPGGAEEASTEEAEKIIARCVRIEPLLREASVMCYRVGLRPGRSQVRLERTDIDGTPVLHNYGHGGSGVTLSWGCAREIADMALKALHEQS